MTTKGTTKGTTRRVARDDGEFCWVLGPFPATSLMEGFECDCS